MPGCTVGQVVTITPGVSDEYKIVDVEHWKVYLSVDNVENPVAIEEIEIVPSDPVGDEGNRTYVFSYAFTIPEHETGTVLSLRFEPSGAASGFAGILDWNSLNYTVVSATIPLNSSIQITPPFAEMAYVELWAIHIIVNGEMGVDNIGFAIPVKTNPVTDEGNIRYDVTFTASVAAPLVVGDTVQWVLRPAGTESDKDADRPIGARWYSDEYGVSEEVLSYMLATGSVSNSFGFLF